MGISKRQKRVQGLKKYNRILSVLIKDKKKKGEIYDLKELRQYASSIYPNFKQKGLRDIKKGVVLSSRPKELLETQRGAERKKETPVFPEDLTNPDKRFYFDLYDMLGDIQSKTSNKIIFESKLEGSEGLIIQGGTKIEPSIKIFYEQNFKNFIHYLDQLRNKGLIDYNDIKIVCTEPKRIPFSSNWKSFIVLAGADGEEVDPDLENLIDNYDPKTRYIIEKAPDKKKKQRPSVAAQIKDDEKQKTLQLALEMVKRGEMSWDRYDQLLDRLYPDK